MSLRWEPIIVEALQKKARTKKELIELLLAKDSKLSYDAARKRIERFLRHLNSLGLVSRKEDIYYWYIYPNIFMSHKEYSAKLKHSKLLLPGLRKIAEITKMRAEMEERVNEILVECAEEHLKYYPFYELIKKCREKREKAGEKKRELEKVLMKKLQEEFGKPSDPVKVRQKFVGENIPSQIYYCIYYSINPLEKFFEYKDKELWFRNTLVAREFNVKNFIVREIKSKENIRTVEEIKKLEKEISELSAKIKQEIHRLILKIESGEPLIGGCKTCPDVYVLR